MARYPARSSSPARCGYCHETVIWALTTAGKRQPLNPTPDEAGNVWAYKDERGTWRARTPSAQAVDRLPWEKIFMPHFATCRARQPRSREQAPAPTARPSPLPSGVADLAAYRARR